MPAYWFGNTIAASGGTLYTTLKIHDEDVSRLTLPAYDFNYRMRNTQVNRTPDRFTVLWPTSSGVGDVGNTRWSLGQSGSGGNRSAFEYWLEGESGAYEPLAVRGIVYQADGTTPQAGATVQLFLTSGDVFVSETTSGPDGSYQAPTPYTGRNHYAVAYLTGSPDVAGTTANTLTPT